jgi:hypothetical protein
MTSERLCAGQPSARAPRTALQNAGSLFAPQSASDGAACDHTVDPGRMSPSPKIVAAILNFGILSLPFPRLSCRPLNDSGINQKRLRVPPKREMIGTASDVFGTFVELLKPRTTNFGYLNCIDQHVWAREAHHDSFHTTVRLQPLSYARATGGVAPSTSHTFSSENGYRRSKWHIDTNPRVHRFFEFILVYDITGGE